MMSWESNLRGSTYATKLNCSSVETFLSKIVRYFRKCRTDNFFVCVENTIEKLKTIRGVINSGKALRLLLSEDLGKVYETMKTMPVNDVEKELKHSLKTYLDILASYDIDISTECFIVDSYPRPYHKFDMWSMQFDIDDQKKFGIKPGIYFLREYLAPIFSSVLLAHELVHACFSKIYRARLARGLEEGFCDLMSFLLASKIFESEKVENTIINMRIFYPQSQLESLYVNNLIMAIYFYRMYGINGILDIIKRAQFEGRDIIKKVESSFMKGKYENLNLEKGLWLKEMDSFCTRIISYSSSYTVSPLAFYLARLIKPGVSIREICKTNNIDLREGRKAIKELQNRVFLILLDRDLIVYDESKEYITSGILRYEVSQ